jgi:hypothetical protein
MTTQREPTAKVKLTLLELMVLEGAVGYFQDNARVEGKTGKALMAKLKAAKFS